jgi:hypothetical protein
VLSGIDMLADPMADVIDARTWARQLGDPYVDVCFLNGSPDDRHDRRLFARTEQGWRSRV